MSEARLRLSGVAKVRRSGESVFRLRVPHLELKAGDRMALCGASGSGKSTLLDILAMILRPDDEGSFRFDTADVGELWRRGRTGELARLRGRRLGYILQTGGLLPFLTLRDNIAQPLRILGLSDDGAVDRLAEELGIAHLLARKPARLSVGERQRGAIARALVHRPAVVLADEPTASIDAATADTVMGLLVELTARHGVALVVASHDVERIDRFGLTRVPHEILRDADAGETTAIFGERP